MDVEYTKPLGNGHSIEIGKSTWDPACRSIRNRYATANGGFSPHSSSEVPTGDMVPMIATAIERKELSANELCSLAKIVADGFRNLITAWISIKTKTWLTRFFSTSSPISTG